jgi:hypothetical protein
MGRPGKTLARSSPALGPKPDYQTRNQMLHLYVVNTDQNVAGKNFAGTLSVVAADLDGAVEAAKAAISADFPGRENEFSVRDARLERDLNWPRSL